MSDKDGAQENPAEYCPGGYHPVQTGEMLNRKYQVIHKVGWGYFSTVWLCHDLQKKKHVAVKISKSGKKFNESALDEIALLNCVNGARKKESQGENIIHFLHDFRLIGENGLHVCLVFELLGPSLLHLMKTYGPRGLPLTCVKRVLQQVLQGLSFLHKKCRIIHTDIKPENILVCVKADNFQQYMAEAEIWNHNRSHGDFSNVLLFCSINHSLKKSKHSNTGHWKSCWALDTVPLPIYGVQHVWHLKWLLPTTCSSPKLGKMSPEMKIISPVLLNCLDEYHQKLHFQGKTLQRFLTSKVTSFGFHTYTHVACLTIW
ncbi:SRSF protein kinase 2-like isoform X8 [Hyla sarda]|uniref:SRSF protein kinase 2-like isoform X8 n=1 Tax=Hyla sarda TaxID=327740 RepID=UPI0024C2B9C6|nr:SRSF protein kinase 2-like isoform X8 [Hyla sarda]